MNRSNAKMNFSGDWNPKSSKIFIEIQSIFFLRLGTSITHLYCTHTNNN